MALPFSPHELPSNLMNNMLSLFQMVTSLILFLKVFSCIALLIILGFFF